MAGPGVLLFANFLQIMSFYQQSQRKQAFRDYSLRDVEPAAPAIQDQAAGDKEITEHYRRSIDDS